MRRANGGCAGRSPAPCDRAHCSLTRRAAHTQVSALTPQLITWPSSGYVALIWQVESDQVSAARARIIARELLKDPERAERANMRLSAGV